MSVNQWISVIMWESCLIILLLLMEGRTYEGESTWGKEGGRHGKVEDNEKMKTNGFRRLLGFGPFYLE